MPTSSFQVVGQYADAAPGEHFLLCRGRNPKACLKHLRRILRGYSHDRIAVIESVWIERWERGQWVPIKSVNILAYRLSAASKKRKQVNKMAESDPRRFGVIVFGSYWQPYLFDVSKYARERGADRASRRQSKRPKDRASSLFCQPLLFE